MADRKEEEPVEFKVVDRRKFNAEGNLRPDAEVEQELPEPEAAVPKKGAQVPPAAEPTLKNEARPDAPKDAPSAGPSPGSAAGAVQFEHLVMSLVTQAMLQLGLATRPGDLAPKADLNAAHETIDILGILVDKTKGNLTPHEDQLLSGSLSELRLAFVEMSRRTAGRIN